MYLDPPLEFARKKWVGQLHAFLGVILNLPCIKSARFDHWAAVGDSSQDTGPEVPDTMLKPLVLSP